MPIESCEIDGKPGFQWAGSSKCYVYAPDDPGSQSDARRKAQAQGYAIELHKASPIRIEKAGDAGLMIALMLPPAIAAKLAVPGGEPVDNLHVTISYLGKLISLPADAYARAIIAMHKVAQEFGPVVGAAGGLGRFNASPQSDDMDVFYASFDSPLLTSLRDAVEDALEDAGFRFQRMHGYSPHITLAYIPKDAPLPVARLESIPMAITGITVASGPDQTTIPFVGMRFVKSDVAGVGEHVHTTVRELGTTKTDGRHAHCFLLPDGSRVESEEDGAHEHSVEDGKFFTSGGPHVHRVALPDGTSLVTEPGGEHLHQLLCATTAFDGVHDHALTMPDGSTIRSTDGETEWVALGRPPQAGNPDAPPASSVSGLPANSGTSVVRPMDDLELPEYPELEGPIDLVPWADAGGSGALVSPRLDGIPALLEKQGKNVKLTFKGAKGIDQLSKHLPTRQFLMDVPHDFIADADVSIERGGKRLTGKDAEILQSATPALPDGDRLMITLSDLPYLDRDLSKTPATERTALLDRLYREQLSKDPAFRTAPTKPARGMDQLSQSIFWSLQFDGATGATLKNPTAGYHDIGARASVPTPTDYQRPTEGATVRTNVLKTDGAQRIVYGVVMRPDFVDAHQDTASPEDVEQAAHWWLENSRTLGLRHNGLLVGVVLESYIAQTDFTLGAGEVKKGDWVLVIRIDDLEVWAGIEAGTYNAFSIGGFGTRQPA